VLTSRIFLKSIRGACSQNPNPSLNPSKVWWKYWTPWSNIVLFRFKSCSSSPNHSNT